MILIPYLLSFIAGALAALSMPGWGFLPLLFIGFSGFYVLLYKAASNRAAFRMGWLFGFGYFVVGLHWIANALLIEDNPYRWAYPLALAGLPALFAIYWGLAAYGVRKLHTQKNINFFLLFVMFFFAAEWLRGHLFTGFPWNLQGYAWAGFLPFVQSVHYIGIYGLTLLTIFVTSLAGHLCVSPTPRTKKAILLFATVALFTAIHKLGAYRLAHTTIPNQPIDLVLVQANIPQKDKWNPEFYIQHFEKQLAMSKSEAQSTHHTVIVWPETAIPSSLFEHPETYKRITKMLGAYTSGATLMTGIMRVEIDGNQESYFNSFAVINSKQEVPIIYDKTHLVPFGEYMPFQKYIPLRPIAEFPSMRGGAGPTKYTVPNIPAFTPLICYEIIFPNNVTPPSKKDRPEWIVNVTNDSWYGITAGPYQHLTHAVFRAVEEGIPVIRVATTGISAVIDPLGRIAAKTGLEYEETLKTPLPSALK